MDKNLKVVQMNMGGSEVVEDEKILKNVEIHKSVQNLVKSFRY
jgi:hypothetical protein